MARKIKQAIIETIEDENGNIKERRENKTFDYGTEPDYVKIYLDTVLFFKSLPKTYNPILMGLLKHMTWADKGQMIYLNASLKRKIAADIGVSKTRIDHAITDFVKGKVLFRKDVGAYQFNSQFFGRGEWQDIAEIRANIIFNPNGTDFAAEIIKTDKINTNKKNNREIGLTEPTDMDAIKEITATKAELAQESTKLKCRHCEDTDLEYVPNGPYGAYYKCKKCGKGTSAEKKGA